MGKKDKKLNIRKWIIISGVLVLAIIAGVVVQLMQRKLASPAKNTTSKTGQTLAPAPSLPKSVLQSRDLSNQGKTAEAQQEIAQSIKSSSDNNEKYELYIQQGVNAINQKDYVGALKSLHQAEAIKADFRITALIADTAAWQGDKVLAKQYYTKALTIIDQNDPLKDNAKHIIEVKLSNLGA